MLYDALMSRALRLAQAGLDDLVPEETLHVQGASYLVDELLGESADRDRTLETLRALFRMIEEKHRLVELLSRCLDTGGLTVVIGSEHTSPDLHAFSLVASTFHDGDRKPGRSASSVRRACAISARFRSSTACRRRCRSSRRPCNLNVG